MCQVLCAALNSWSTFARQHARLRTVVVRIVHRDTAAALLSWRDYMRRMAGARALLRRAVTSQKQLCWDTWWHFATQVPQIQNVLLSEDSCQGNIRETLTAAAKRRGSRVPLLLEGVCLCGFSSAAHAHAR